MSTEERAVKLHDSLGSLEDAAIEFARLHASTGASRWQVIDARRALVRASVRHGKAVERARKDRGR